VTSIVVNHAQPSAAKAIIRQWMSASEETLARHDVAGHLALISKQVKVHGVPELDVIDYNDWAAQVEHEFKNQLVRSVKFHGDHIRAEKPDNIIFVTLEVITAADGTVINNGLEVVLNKESDGVWRVVQERILDEGESRHFNLL